MQTNVTIKSRTPHYWPREELDADGNVVQPAVYAGLIVDADIQIGADTRSGQHSVDLPEDASDEEVSAALLAQYGVKQD